MRVPLLLPLALPVTLAEDVMDALSDVGGERTAAGKSMMSRRSGDSGPSCGDVVMAGAGGIFASETRDRECGRPMLSCEAREDCGEGECGTCVDRGRSVMGRSTSGREGEYLMSQDVDDTSGPLAGDLTEWSGEEIDENEMEVRPGESVARTLPGE